MMKILVDADACPVKEIIEKVAKQKNIEVVMYIDSSHILSSDYSKIVTISKGRDAVDLALINDSEKGDVIVTQDYGVASLALGRSAYAIGNSDLFMITIILINLCLKGFWDRKYAEPAEKAVRRLIRKRELKKMTNGLNEIF